MLDYALMVNITSCHTFLRQLSRRFKHSNVTIFLTRIFFKRGYVSNFLSQVQICNLSQNTSPRPVVLAEDTADLFFAWSSETGISRSG